MDRGSRWDSEKTAAPLPEQPTLTDIVQRLDSMNATMNRKIEDVEKAIRDLKEQCSTLQSDVKGLVDELTPNIYNLLLSPLACTVYLYILHPALLSLSTVWGTQSLSYSYKSHTHKSQVLFMYRRSPISKNCLFHRVQDIKGGLRKLLWNPALLLLLLLLLPLLLHIALDQTLQLSDRLTFQEDYTADVLTNENVILDTAVSSINQEPVMFP
ncbi:hypothetical protein ACOMHN_031638 [Nucella lapillus]